MLLPLISIPSQPVWSFRQAEHVTNIRSFCPSGGSYVPANTDLHNIPFECAIIILGAFCYFSLFWVGFILGYVFLLVSRSIRCSVTCVGVAVPLSACCLMTPEKKLSSSLSVV